MFWFFSGGTRRFSFDRIDTDFFSGTLFFLPFACLVLVLRDPDSFAFFFMDKVQKPHIRVIRRLFVLIPLLAPPHLPPFFFL